MKRDADFFGEGRAELVYIAKRLRDAQRLESILTAAGVDYGVEADEYRSGVIFRSVRAGAFFYVLPNALDAAHDIMLRHGYKPFVEPATGIPEA